MKVEESLFLYSITILSCLRNTFALELMGLRNEFIQWYTQGAPMSLKTQTCLDHDPETLTR